MSDNITLPRELVERALRVAEVASKHAGLWTADPLIEALRAALAAPRLEVTVDPRLTPAEAAAISSALAAPEPEPVAYFDLQKQVFFWAKPTMIDVPMTVALNPLPLYAAPPAAAPEPEPVRCNPAAMRTTASSPAVLFITELDPPALASPRPEPVAWQYKDEPSFDGNCWHDNYQVTTSKQVAQFKDKNAQPLYAAPPATHPGYVIGNHWLETAYSRVCAGEAEADVLRDCGWERVGDAEALRRDAERWRRLLEGASIAADADTSTASAAVDASKAPEDKT